MDDLRHIEAIVATQPPPNDSYEAAFYTTDFIRFQAQEDPCGWRTLQRNFSLPHRWYGVKRRTLLVRIARHCMAIRHHTGGADKAWADSVGRSAALELAEEGLLDRWYGVKRSTLLAPRLKI
ncbi:unnamed protein product [Symbiodinium natans]|uniref:Uncharacterized protein n=1 Tax=Symbiodinium natans TaxID=878477 RepID=A0A812STS5_9DINO|nr:unnamed protein product [Symbiodinium natans]